MKNQTRGLSNLPKSSSKFWHEDSVKDSKDMQTAPDTICGATPESHNYVIDPANREAACGRCGLGFKFKVNEVEIREDILYDKATNKRLT